MKICVYLFFCLSDFLFTSVLVLVIRRYNYIINVNILSNSFSLFLLSLHIECDSIMNRILLFLYKFLSN